MRAYTQESYNRFCLAVRSICRSEMHPGNTICFMSEVDLSAMERIRGASQEKGATRPSYTSFVAKAVALALKDFPDANRRVFTFPWGSRIVRFHQVDIAVAIEKNVPNAPMIAHMEVIRAADTLSLEQITVRLREFGSATPENSGQWGAFSRGIALLPAWIFSLVMKVHSTFPSFWCRYRGGACMISSPAKYGVDQVSGTWTHPLGVSLGQVKWSAVVRDGQIVPRKTFALTLNWNRTVFAGAPAAKFFNRITFLLENAETELC